MKKILSLLLIIVTLLSFASCGTKPPSNNDQATNETQNTSVVIKPSPDKYTWYIKNYVGKNCAAIGDWWTIGGYIHDSYGEGAIKIHVFAEDGSFVDSETAKEYVVVRQSIAPNTELKYTFKMNEDGTESKYFIESQNIEEIEVYVKRINNNIENNSSIVETSSKPKNNTTSDDTEWKQFLKDYEAWVDDYIAIVKKYKNNPTDMSILSDYTEMVSEMAEWSEKADEIELELEDTAEALEYSKEVLRIAGKLAEAAY